jgi:hypothetical protein
MKNGQNLRELQNNKQKADIDRWIKQPVCCVCGKLCEGYHGRWGDSGTCNSACEKKKAAKYPYPGHSEAEFFERMSK